MVIISILIAAAVFLIDKLTKIWALATLANGDIVLINGVFRLHLAPPNTGAAWGILSGNKPLLIIITFCLLGFLIFYYCKLPKTKVGNIARILISVITGGALGNLYERIFAVGVTDFLYFDLINFPVFNFADMCVVCGTIAFALLVLFAKDEKLI